MELKEQAPSKAPTKALYLSNLTPATVRRFNAWRAFAGLTQSQAFDRLATHLPEVPEELGPKTLQT